MQFGFLDVSLVAEDFCENTEVDVVFGKMSKNPKFGTMLSFKLPCHVTHILSGDGDH